MQVSFMLATLAATTVGLEMLQHPLKSTGRHDPQSERKKIAVIGAGLSGATFAYQLHNEYVHLIQSPVGIVVFKASSQAGGLIKSTFTDDRADVYRGYIETGGNLFRANDSCLQEMINSTGLRDEVLEVPFFWNDVGMWDAENFIARRIKHLKAVTESDYLEDLRNYGSYSVKTLHSLMYDKLSRFYDMHKHWRSSDGYSNLPLRLRQAGLEDESQQRADRYFLDKRIGSNYLHGIVEPSIRQYLGHELRDVNTLSAMVAMDFSPAFKIWSEPNGMRELGHRLLLLPDAEIQLNTRVSTISRSKNRKLVLNTSDTS